MESTSFPLPLLYAFPSVSSVSLYSSLDSELSESWSLALFISMPAALSMGAGTEQALSWPLVELKKDGDKSSLNELKGYFWAMLSGKELFRSEEIGYAVDAINVLVQHLFWPPSSVPSCTMEVGKIKINFPASFAANVSDILQVPAVKSPLHKIWNWADNENR